MAGRVPIARRGLFQDRRRAALAAAGVAAPILLVLLLDGVFAGAMNQVTAYLRASPADVIVAQKDVRTMHMSVSALPPSTVGEARRVPGVAWAEGIRFASATVDGPAGHQLSYVIGYDPAGRAGPQNLTEGRPPRDGEAIVDSVGANRIGLSVGGHVMVFGKEFRVSGLSQGLTSMVNTTTFITKEDFARLRGPNIAYVMVGARPGVTPEELVARLQRALPQTTVQTRTGFANSEAAIVKDMSADVMQIMTTVALLIALAVIGLTLFTLTLAKLREHAVVKALGSPNRGVGLVVLAQAAWSVALALALAVVLALAIGFLVGRLDPSLEIAVEPSSVVRAGLGALLVGALGSVIPLRRVFVVDPASAFRRAS